MKFRLTLFYGFLSITLLPHFSLAQLNMVLQDSMDYNVGVNDVCGWVAPDGKEYALVGINTGVSIVDVNVTPIKEVVFVPGVDNLWRDINTFGHYAYVSSEARVGLLIIDLQYLPDSVTTYIWNDTLPTSNGGRPFEKAHTLWTDDDGRLYLNGSNVNGGGVVICDIATDPTDPIFLGYAPAIYSHDCYTRDSIIYSAEIYAGDLSIYDARDPQNITLLGRVKTPYEFTHNGWISDNGKYLFTTDERANSYVTSYDISDPANIIELDRYRQAATDGLGNIPHNAYVWNDWVIVAYYANGTIILDAQHPDNLVEVGNFDSFLGEDGGFPGVWGSYPFLPSGKILSSDRNNGLFVFVPNYVRACYLEGAVIDTITKLPLNNAVVTVISDEILYPQSTRPDGTFKMGKAIPGQYAVTVTRPGYYEKTITLEFVNGEILSPVIELEPYPTWAINGKVIFDDTQADAPFAKVIAHGPLGIYTTTCDAQGNFLLPAIFQGGYELQAGIWGYTYETQIVMNQPINLTLNLKRGYVDDFDLDLEWSVSGQVSSGAWTREVPQPQSLFDEWSCGSAGDTPFDSGIFAYSTGNSQSEDVQDTEVSGGTTWLSTPPMDLTQAIDPEIAFDYWLCEFPPNQYEGLYVWVSNGMDTFLLDILRNDTIVGSWQSKLYDNLAIPAPLDQIRFMVSARDTTTGTNFYVLKAHIDNFELIDGSLGTDNASNPFISFDVYPNPLTGDRIYFTSLPTDETNPLSIAITDIQGRVLAFDTKSVFELQQGLQINLNEGLYFVHWSSQSGTNGIGKLVVLKE